MSTLPVITLGVGVGGVALLAIPMAAGWCGLCVWLGRRQERLRQDGLPQAGQPQEGLPQQSTPDAAPVSAILPEKS
ncbi:hypothetical protein D3C85_1785910 [compost metagenome]